MKKLLTFLFIIMLMGAGCSQSAPSGASDNGSGSKNSILGKSYDPCELLQQSDFAAFYPGEEVKITQHDMEANVVGQKICYYDIGEDMKFAELSLVSSADMSAGLKASGQNAETLYQQEKDLMENIQAVNGIGDEAYYGGSGLAGGGLNVLVKNKGVKFSVIVGLGFGNDDEAEHLKIESAIAKKILEKL